MDSSKDISFYFPAAQINRLPRDLSKPRHILYEASREQRRKNYENCTTVTEIWNAADTDEGRRSVLSAHKASGNAEGSAFEILEMFLQSASNRLPF